MTPNARFCVLYACFLLVLLGVALAQVPPRNDVPGFSDGPQGAVPDTPEQPQNDIHVEAPPEVHPDIIEGIAGIPPPPSDPGAVESVHDDPPLNPPPAEPVDAVPGPDGQPVDAPVDTPAEVLALAEALPKEPLPDAETNQPEGAPPEQVEPPPVPEEDKGPFNPWRVPSPGQPAVELQAGSSFNFSWTSNTEGLVNLELWKIEGNTPVPKYLLASDKPNDGSFEWKILGNFPHGTGYCVVIVPPDRNRASLSPLFTILGDTDYDMPAPPPDHRPTLDSLEVSLVGTQKKLLMGVGIGFVICNVVASIAWFANDRERSRLDSHALYSTLQKGSGKRVFHARTPSNPRRPSNPG